MLKYTSILLLMAGLAQAQVVPEFMLLIDTSRQMREGAVCAPAGTNDRARDFDDTGVAFAPSYLHMVQDALAGSRRGDLYCKEFALPNDAARDPADALHTRAYCGNNNLSPCGHDHGDPDGPFPNGNAQTAKRGNDGIIKLNKNDFKFGLMTADARPAIDNNEAGSYSFGLDTFRGGGDAIEAEDQPLAGARLARPNMGIKSLVREANGPEFGPLIECHKGKFTGNNWRLDEVLPLNGGGLSSHNTAVGDYIERLYSDGEHLPLAAMLQDAVQYYDDDDELGCRKRNMIVISRGVEGHGYFRNDLTERECEDELDKFSVDGIVNRCVGAAPYAPSWTHAQALRALGVNVYVIGLNPPSATATAKLQRVAAFGSPGAKPDGSPGYYAASSEAELRAAINEILNLSAPDFEGRARPLVIIPGPGDTVEGVNEDIRQWRFVGRSEISKDEDTRYGQMEEQRLGCDEARIDADRPGSLVDFASHQVHERLRTLVTRRAFTRQKTAVLDRHVALIGGMNATAYNQTGGAIGVYADAELTAMLGGEVPLDFVGAFINGFFGERGLPDGRLPPRGPRQLAAISKGDIVAIPPPNLGLASPSYQDYEQRHGDRPTLVAAGANDGMIHFFHAATGDEFFNFIPAKALALMSKAVKDNGYEAYAQMDVADLALCRTLGDGGGGQCPSNPEDIEYGTFLTGALMNGDANLFGLNLTGIDDPDPLKDKLEGLLDMRAAVAQDRIWNITEADVSKLGATTSRPQLTHVRTGDQVKAALIVGCGDTPGGAGADAEAGHCVLIIDAQTGALLGEINKDNAGEAFNQPMVGGPAVYPAGGISTAELVYIGDKIGRIWRVDLRETDKADWSAAIAWPPEEPDDLERKYQLGRAVLGRPSVALREDGRRVVVFATAGDGPDGVDSTVVSFTDTLIDDGQGGLKLRAVGNWVFPLGADEEATDAPVVRDGIALFTTKRTVAPDAECGDATEGRLIGVDYFRQFVDQDGNAVEFERNGRRISVLPALPLNIGNGAKALALVLPPGRVAYGLTIVTTPTCLTGGVPSTEVILNLSEQSSGGGGAVSTREMMVERVQNGAIQQVAFDNQIFSESKGQTLSICLNCDETGNAQATGGSARSSAPFPSILLYWGTSFSD